MRNLLEETTKCIEDSGHSVLDIVFIGSEKSGHCCSWEQFEELADVTYDQDFGASEVATDLIIVFSDGAKMWRDEYDGSEWWGYSKPFKKPAISKPITRLVDGQVLWGTLEQLNRHR